MPPHSAVFVLLLHQRIKDPSSRHFEQFLLEFLVGLRRRWSVNPSKHLLDALCVAVVKLLTTEIQRDSDVNKGRSFASLSPDLVEFLTVLKIDF